MLRTFYFVVACGLRLKNQWEEQRKKNDVAPPLCNSSKMNRETERWVELSWVDKNSSFLSVWSTWISTLAHTQIGSNAAKKVCLCVCVFFNCWNHTWNVWWHFFFYNTLRVRVEMRRIVLNWVDISKIYK